MIHGIDTSFLVAVELASHPRHSDARQKLHSLSHVGDQFALTPLVLAEFLHVVTDQRRCVTPLTMDVALNRAEQLWNASETIQIHPTSKAITQFFDWMRTYCLGRKRLLDTQLAATFHAAGIKSILTLNPSDFRPFGYFSIQ